MNHILHIFKKDIKNISLNWAAAIIVGGLVLLPSLYAWLNIAAMWDPYSHTNQIPVGIVNEDKEAKVRNQSIHAGKELADSLRKSDDLDWKFTDRKEALNKLRNGDLFAVIMIPEDFSAKLATVISDHPEKAKVEYYVNEKINSISPKITQKGASMIVEQVSSKFIATVNGVIFELFNEIGIELQRDLPDIKHFEQYIFQLEDDLPEINRLINSTLKDAADAEGMVHQAQGMIPEAKQLTNDGLETINKTVEFMSKAEQRLQEMSPKINEDLALAQKITSDVDQFLDAAQNKDIDLSTGEQAIDQLQSKLNESIETLAMIESALMQVQNMINQNKNDEHSQTPSEKDTGAKIQQALEQIQILKTDFEQIQEKTSTLNGFMDNKKKEFDEAMAGIKQAAGDTSVKLDAFAKEYKENIEPTVLAEMTKAQNTLSGAKKILTDVQTSLPGVETILNRTEQNLGKGKKALEYAHGEFPYINEKVRELADKIRKVQGETDINEIIQLLLNDPKAEKSFFEEPVQLNENKLFPIKNYGTGMTPFYTVLSIWVGALLLISLLAVDLKDREGFTGRQVYFGRYLTFSMVGLLQTFIVITGDLAILRVPVQHPVWMMLFGFLIGVVFMLIVYTLVSVFGNIGKAMAIIMLVLQIAGSGGTYPVVLLPEFFQVISPFLPFTYAVDLMREAVGGIVWERVWQDVMFLCLFGLAAVLFGAFLKDPINRKAHPFIKKSKEADIFH